MKYILFLLISSTTFANSLSVAKNNANIVIDKKSISFENFVEKSITELKVCTTWKCLELENKYLNESRSMKSVLLTFNCTKELKLLNKFDNYYTSRTQIAARLPLIKRKEIEAYQKNYYSLLIDELSFLKNCRV